MLKKIIILICFSISLVKLVNSQVKTKIDWPSFMAQHDLVWEDIPLQWNEGAFVGNGQVGMMIYTTLKDNRIDFHIGRQDVTDHRKAQNKKTSLGVDGAGIREDYPRLSIGRIVLRPAGKIISGTMRQDLWNAEIRGTIVTNLGEIIFKAFTTYDRMLNVVEVSSTEKILNQYAPFRWEFIRGNSNAPRRLTHPQEDWSQYVLNPPAQLLQKDGVSVCVQPLFAGGDYASAWIEKPGAKEGQSTLLLSTANEVPANNLSSKVATKTVKDAALLSADTLIKNHRQWWHTFYQKSFLSIPDGRIESFYWIQLYKMATSSRPDGPAVDLFGPYFRISQWGGHWWNLNVQLSYWLVYPTNHLELGENLITIIDQNFDAFLKKAIKVTGTFTAANLGDFTWLMHNYWLQYSSDGDWKSLKEKWMPKAAKIAAAFQKILIKGEDGKLHLPPMVSPEYIAKDKNKLFKDSNYNLALLRWLLNTLTEVSEKTHTKSTQIDSWKQILSNLCAFPVDENGLMIGSDQSVDQSHRHFSHLLALYPFYQLNPDSPDDRALVEKSVIHWHKIDNGKGLAGYSYTGAASLYAALGRGNDALPNIQRFLTGDIGQLGKFLPNTFYAETYGKSPCFETPMSAATATVELLLQSWGGKIRVFPAMPSKWKQASFHQMMALGGFLVSASRSDSKTSWVLIKSLRGEPCVVKIPLWTQAVQMSSGRKISITSLGNSEFHLDLKVNEQVLLSPDGNTVSAIVSPIWHPANEKNLFGVRKGDNLKEEMVWPETDEKYL